jgi:hypothetical protein
VRAIDLQRTSEADQISGRSNMLRGHSSPISVLERFVNVRRFKAVETPGDVTKHDGYT